MKRSKIKIKASKLAFNTTVYIPLKYVVALLTQTIDNVRGGSLNRLDKYFWLRPLKCGGSELNKFTEVNITTSHFIGYFLPLLQESYQCPYWLSMIDIKDLIIEVFPFENIPNFNIEKEKIDVIDWQDFWNLTEEYY